MTYPSPRTEALLTGYNPCTRYNSRERTYMPNSKKTPLVANATHCRTLSPISGIYSSMGSAPSSRSSPNGRVAQSPRIHRKFSSSSLEDQNLSNGAVKTEYFQNPNFRYDDNSKVSMTHITRVVNGFSKGSQPGRPLPQGPGPLIPSKHHLSSGKRRSDSVAGKGPLRANHDIVGGSQEVFGTHSLDAARPRKQTTVTNARRKSLSLSSIPSSIDQYDHLSDSQDHLASTKEILNNEYKQTRAGYFQDIDYAKARKSFQVTRSPSFDNLYSASRAGKSKNVSDIIHDRQIRGTLTSQKHHRSLDDVRHNDMDCYTEKRVVNSLGSNEHHTTDNNAKQIRSSSIESRSDFAKAESDAYSVNNPLNGRAKRLQRRLSQSADDESNDSDRSERKIRSLNATGLVGLRNLGNTCFMNSIIQCLSCTRQLREYFSDERHEKDINETFSPMKGKLALAFGRLIKEIWSVDNAKSVISPNHLKSQIQRYAPRFTGFSQQDSQEFLRFLLEGLHEDLNQNTRKEKEVYAEEKDVSDHEKALLSWQRYQKKEKSLISDLFVGQLKSILKCTMCEKRSVTFDPFWDLSLPIPSKIKMSNRVSLYDCFDAFTQEEVLDGDEKPTCEHCKKRRKCIKRFLIERFPRVLVIHLKRFSEVRFRTKLNTLVEFPADLNLTRYAANSGGTKAEVLYRLYSISNHSGGTYSGHYTAYCRHPYTSDWHVFSDSRFDKISPGRLVSAEAYVLFYELQVDKPNV